MLLRYYALALLLSALAPFHPAQGLTIGQIDNFESGTLEGWGPGDPGNLNPPRLGPICGRSGCLPGTDQYLLVLGNGIAALPGSAVLAANSAQWAGDYVGAGITELAMWVNNLGTRDLNLRLAIESTNGDRWATATDKPLPAPSANFQDWTLLRFDLLPSAWVDVGTTPASADANSALQSVATLRILSSASASWEGDDIPGVLAVDLITAIPEPGTALLVSGGLLALAIGTPRRDSSRSASE